MSSLPKNSMSMMVVPGVHKSTHFIMADNPLSYAFMVEKVDSDLFELSIFTIDDDDNRVEFVVHCPSQGLIQLSQGIATTLYKHNQIKERMKRDT